MEENHCPTIINNKSENKFIEAEINKDLKYEIDSFEDIDNDEIIYSSNNDYLWIQKNKEGIMYIEPKEENIGKYLLNITAEDSFGCKTSKIFYIKVDILSLW